MDSEQQTELSAELKQKVSELVSHFARTHQTRIGRRYEYRGFNHAIIEHGIANLLATEIQREENRAAELERTVFDEYLRVAPVGVAWVDSVQAVLWMGREIDRLRHHVAELEKEV